MSWLMSTGMETGPKTFGPVPVVTAGFGLDGKMQSSRSTGAGEFEQGESRSLPNSLYWVL